jgi:hypothetical protein
MGGAVGGVPLYPSSLRMQGPITPGVSDQKPVVEHRARIDRPRRIGSLRSQRRRKKRSSAILGLHRSPKHPGRELSANGAIRGCSLPLLLGAVRPTAHHAWQRQPRPRDRKNVRDLATRLLHAGQTHDGGRQAGHRRGGWRQDAPRGGHAGDQGYFRDGVAHFASPVANDFMIGTTPPWIRRQFGS